MVAFYFVAKATFKKGKALPSFQLENMPGCLQLYSLRTACAALCSEEDVFFDIQDSYDDSDGPSWQLSAALKWRPGNGTAGPGPRRRRPQRPGSSSLIKGRKAAAVMKGYELG